MKHKYLFLLLFSFALLPTFAFCQNFKFAFLSDTHIGAPETAAEDLERTVQDINAMSEIAFVVITGDITDYGSDAEFNQAKSIFDKLNKKWYIIPGNHDSKWSESGANSFRKGFGSERFAFSHNGYWFLGCASGPNMRMAPGLVAREDILWLDSTVNLLKRKNEPFIFLNHYPMDNGLGNWYLVLEKLKQGNIQALLCGHGHNNRAANAEGIPGTMGRSNLRAKNAVGGYNLVTVQNDSMHFAERTPGQATGKTWRSIVLKDHQFSRETKKYPRPDYSLNEKYTNVKVVWQFEESSDIGTGLAQNNELAFYGTATGQVVAIDKNSGIIKWRFVTKGKIYTTPGIQKNKLVVASTDGGIYCLDSRSGKLIWEIQTGKPIVASPHLDKNIIYLGSSEGKFRALALKDGKEIWAFTQVAGFTESVPIVDKKRVYFGSWGSKFYALDKKTGNLTWTWTNNKIRNFSPAACEPVLAHNKIFLQTPDRTITALDATSGKEIWKSGKHKGFESLGISENKKLVYIKCMNDTVWAFSTVKNNPAGEWFVNCNYGYEISPSPLTEQNGVLFVPTDKGVLYAINPKEKKVMWAQKFSNALVNKVLPLPNQQVILTTMDGKVVKLQYDLK